MVDFTALSAALPSAAGGLAFLAYRRIANSPRALIIVAVWICSAWDAGRSQTYADILPLLLEAEQAGTPYELRASVHEAVEERKLIS